MQCHQQFLHHLSMGKHDRRELSDTFHIYNKDRFLNAVKPNMSQSLFLCYFLTFLFMTSLSLFFAAPDYAQLHTHSVGLP